MPIYVGYTQKRRTVRLLTAGSAQFLLCPPSDIELAAYVSDITNTRNHTFLWTQIKGPTVTLASTDTLGTSFPFLDSDDKTFRFFVDPGTNREQYKDVDVFYTPTSVLEQKAAGFSKPFQKSMTTPNVSQVGTFLLGDIAGVVNSNVMVIPATAVTFDEQSLNYLNNTIKVEILTDAGYVVNPEDLYETHTELEIPLEFPLPNGVYRFRFHYDFGTLEPSQMTSPLIICNSTVSEDDAWGIDDVYEGRGLQSVSALSNMVRFSIKRFGVDEAYTLGGSGIKSGLTNVDGSFYNPVLDPPPITITIPRLVDYVEFPELLDDNSMYTVNTGLLDSFVRLDPSNIGS